MEEYPELDKYRDKHEEPKPIIKAILEDSIRNLQEAIEQEERQVSIEKVFDILNDAESCLPAMAWGSPLQVKQWLSMTPEEGRKVLKIGMSQADMSLTLKDLHLLSG